MGSAPAPSHEDLARYLEQNGALTKPWLMLQLRLSRLKKEKDSMGADEYLRRVQDAHTDLMRLGSFWRGREAELFGHS
ncbi:hypothetical protein KBY67_04360 [Synechococcus sp. RedBA-s]|nr:hypothetical protein [Synechococcus sp. RedBA-s]